MDQICKVSSVCFILIFLDCPDSKSRHVTNFNMHDEKLKEYFEEKRKTLDKN